MSHYLQFSKNIFSQNGEDGIIHQLFSDLKIQNGVLIEFGAWDGIYLSNIYNLTKQRTFNTIFIESDTSKFSDLKKLTSENIECLNTLVSPNKNDSNSIDNILYRSKFSGDIDISLMSIDVDSCDYYIFDSITKFYPKIVMVETNYRYNYDQPFVSYNDGCSLNSINELAVKKGYTLVCHTLNAIFVKNEYINQLPNIDINVKSLYLTLDEILEQQKINADGVKTQDLYYTTQEYTQRLDLEKKLYENITF